MGKPRQIKKEDIIKAINVTKKERLSSIDPSEDYYILYDDFLFPARYILSLANKTVQQQNLDLADYDSVNKVLTNLGYTVLHKPEDLGGAKWLVSYGPENWQVCLQHSVLGFNDKRLKTLNKVKVGDKVLGYIHGTKIVGIFEITSPPYHDESKLWNDGLYPNRVKIRGLVVPKQPLIIKELYRIYLGFIGDSGGYFGQSLRILPDEEFAIFQAELYRNLNQLTPYDGNASKERFQVFITSYPEKNLVTSKNLNILGWKEKKESLNIGDRVFVYNSTKRQIETCFELKSKQSANTNTIWEDEVQGNPKTIYANRWDARVLLDGLGVTLSDIRSIEPFKSNRRAFSHLLRSESPRSIDAPKFSTFRNLLLERSRLTAKSPIYTMEVLCQKTYLKSSYFKELEVILREKGQVVLYGPPGTGKTFIATEFSKYIIDKFGGSSELVQFHPSYSYEDFVEGIKPQLKNDKINYVPTDGIFKQICNDARKNSAAIYVLLIDEINRGNLSKIFGELIYALEYRGEATPVRLPYSYEKFSIPKNLWIIGTMNSADRSIALVDYALRRRFYFVELLPNGTILKNFLQNYPPSGVTADSVVEIFKAINQIISEDNKLGKYYQLGHSYFFNRQLDEEAIKRIWKYSIKPILQEYYFEENERLDEIEKNYPILTNPEEDKD